MLRYVMSAPAAIWSPDARHASLEYCLASKGPGHGCNSHSISCVQTGRSNNSIAAANSLTGEAQVQKSRIMQSRPAGNCCPKAISFNIGQASIGITHRLNKSSHTSYLIFMPASFSLNTKFHTHIWSEGRSNKWPRPKLFSCWDDVEWGCGGVFHGLPSYGSPTSTSLSCLHKTGTDDRTEEEREMPVEIHGPPLRGPQTAVPVVFGSVFSLPLTPSCAEHQGSSFDLKTVRYWVCF